MQLQLVNVPVDGGDLRVLLWGTGKRVAVAVHGITASGMSWQAVARHMPADWTLAAPDLRGRGHSHDLPGPYGLDRHASDVAAVLRHFGGRPVLAGHSMGAYIALLTRDAHPELVRRLVLVDGGLPLPVPEGTDPDAVLDATLGPAISRLRQTSRTPRPTWISGGRTRRWPGTGPPTWRPTPGTTSSARTATCDHGPPRTRCAPMAVMCWPKSHSRTRSAG